MISDLLWVSYIICDSFSLIENMPDYCHLRGGVYFFDSIPMTPSGKINRRLVKETVNEQFKKRRQLA